GAITASISSGALPPGLTLDPNTGQISGTPTVLGDFTFTVQVKDSFTPPAVATQVYNLHVAAPLVITPPVGTDGVVNVPYTLNLPATGGTGPDIWTLLSGSMPAGLKLSATGVISGVPTQVSLTGNTVTLQARDSGNLAQMAQVNITIRVAAALVI